MKKTDTKKIALIGAGTALAYSFVKGLGIFNVPRFYNQHKAIKKYLETNYPSAHAGDIFKTKLGWGCIINNNNQQILITLEKTNDKNYVFTEKEM